MAKLTRNGGGSRPQKRQYRRFTLHYPVNLKFDLGTSVSELRAFSSNISLGGVLLQSASAIPQHCDVSFVVTVSGHQIVGPIQIVGEGEVVRVEPHSSGAGAPGLEFERRHRNFESCTPVGNCKSVTAAVKAANPPSNTSVRPRRSAFSNCGHAADAFLLDFLPLSSASRESFPWMNPMHREAVSAASLDLFQQRSTSDQQFTRPPVLSSRLGRIEPVFPARPSGTGQPFGSAGSSACTSMHAAPPICHRGRLTRGSSASFGSASGSEIWIPARIAIFQPVRSFRDRPIIQLSFFHCLLKPFPDQDGLPSPL